MTDQEINRAVAEARGWHTNDGVAWIMPCGTPQFLHDVCTDPAAWGALYVEIAERGMCPGIESHLPGLDGDEAYEASMYGLYPSKDPTMSRDVIDVRAETPGRALALAFLKAVQK